MQQRLHIEPAIQNTVYVNILVYDLVNNTVRLEKYFPVLPQSEIAQFRWNVAAFRKLFEPFTGLFNALQYMQRMFMTVMMCDVVDNLMEILFSFRNIADPISF